MTPTVIYVENTPNPAAMKFVANRILVNGPSIEFVSADQTANAPFAARLFKFPFVTGIFLSGNFVTISKSNAIEWDDVTGELREFIRLYLSEDKPILTEQFTPEVAKETAKYFDLHDVVLMQNHGVGRQKTRLLPTIPGIWKLMAGYVRLEWMQATST